MPFPGDDLRERSAVFRPNRFARSAAILFAPPYGKTRITTMDYEQRLTSIARLNNAPYVEFLRRTGLAIDVVQAEGSIVTDARGRQYVDCIAGYGNCTIGHNPKPVIDAVVAELQSPRPFNLPFVHDVQALALEKLVAVAPRGLDCCFIVNSGAEAVESALKLARLATGKAGVVCMQGAWHGFTFGCLSISEQSMTRQFAPLLEGVKRVPFGNVNAADAAIDGSVGCVIVEPIQSENGAVVPPTGYLAALRNLCSQRGVMLIFDEVKTGIAKSGRMFASMLEDVVPDVLVCGKALGGGVMPIGALMANRRFWGRFGLSFPMSSSSGAGNAPACAAALATLEHVESESLCERAMQRGSHLKSGLEALAVRYPDTITGVDGCGVLLSLCTRNPKSALDIVAQCAHRGVLVMAAFCNRRKILIEPPACISEREVTKILDALSEAVEVSSGV